jgi:hypothetical protein
MRQNVEQPRIGRMHEQRRNVAQLRAYLDLDLFGICQ